MMRRTLMKRTPMSPGRVHASDYYENREQRLSARALAAIKSAAGAKNAVSERNRPTALANKAQAATKSGVMEPTCGPIAKQIQMRSEAYRRAVASLPCAHCGIEGYSQHAHENGPGKAKGMKVDDRRAMPLCCARPGVEGCHAAFDQYRLVPGGRAAHRAQGQVWAAQTRQQIEKSGRWPSKLPRWQEGGRDGR